MALLELKDIYKIYKTGQMEVNALNGVSISVEEGEFVSIMGPSGSGKSTMLNVIGCLDLPTTGSYTLANEQVEKMKDKQLAITRNHLIGFVFQSFHLLPNLTAQGNVELPMIYSGTMGEERKKRAVKALEAVGLGDRIHHKPNQLSGGQQQRVAIARAIVSNPKLILADEPTGALDSKSSENIMELFQQLNKTLGVTIVQVTHDAEVSLYGDRVYHMLDGIVERVEKIDHE